MKKNINQTKIWNQLNQHYENTKNIHMTDLFKNDKNRFTNMQIKLKGLLLDYSKNRINTKTLSLLIELANTVNLKNWIKKLFNGEKINTSENKPALHTALRAKISEKIFVNNINIVPQIHKELNKALDFAQSIRDGVHKGYSGKKIKNIINIGIGGSYLGLKMLTSALTLLKKKELKIFFLSNVDALQIANTLKNLNPEETIFIIASKSFTTYETLLNAQVAKKWFTSNTKQTKIDKHFFAASNNKEKALEFGIPENNFFYIFDWVGGRFSSWSAMGLCLMIAIGKKNFLDFIDGGKEMDSHFFNTPFKNNLPVILALIGIWYNNFYNINNHAIIPYSNRLREFPAFIQQLDMESNGKSCDRDGGKLDFNTGVIVWGEEGVNCQHAFFQLLHQGTRLISSDFIVIAKNDCKDMENQHYSLIANAFAQTKALMTGKDTDKNLTAQKSFDGNQPSNTILINQLNPFNLGMLVALYEHKIFVQGIIWGINSFDQWGVEYGKKLAFDIENKLKNNIPTEYDSSTNGLIYYYRKMNNE